MLPKLKLRRHERGQADHVDAWLMSYADLITLLCMFFVIFVAVPQAMQENPASTQQKEKYPDREERFGILKLQTPFDEAYRALVGIAADNAMEQNISVEQTARSMKLELSAIVFFQPGSAEFPAHRLALLKTITRAVQGGATEHSMIEVEGYTDDVVPEGGTFANNWELSAMRATRIVSLLIAEGVEPSRLKAVSYAANRPLLPNADARGAPITENRAKNQRVVIRIENRPSIETPIGLF
jgi:chemotaxis protein MotB